MNASIRKNLAALVVGAFLVASVNATAIAADVTPADIPTEQRYATSESILFERYDRVPVVETNVVSEMPVGGGTIPLPYTQGESALLRLSVFNPDKDVTLTAAGAPALFVAEGEYGSTTVLAPIQDGRAQVHADASAMARVEVLASFGANQDAPGSVIALDSAVRRVNSAEGFGMSGLGAVTQEVAVTGVGGVPGEELELACGA